MSSTEDLTALITSLVTLMPVDAAAAASLTAPFDVETLVATSDRAASLLEIQLDLGEGPVWDAFRSRRTVHLDLDGDGGGIAGSLLVDAHAAADISGIIAVPLSFGPMQIGAVVLFSTRHPEVDAEQMSLAESIVPLLGRAVVARALEEADDGATIRDASLSRREVHQATGMVMSQTRSTPTDALLLLRAYAFSNEMTVRQVAADIIARRLDFSPDHDKDL